MKKTVFILCCMALLMLPAGAWAYQNEIEVGLEGGSGDYKEPGATADVSTSAFSLGYTRYFNDVETNDTPYGERVFLQHPSFLGAAIAGYSEELEANGAFTGVKMEDEGSALGLGGKYYLPSNTGLGLIIVSMSGEEKWSVNGVQVSKDETDGNAIILSVDHYVTENVGIGASYHVLSLDEKDDSGAKTEISGKVIELEARGLINNKFAISAMIGTGDLEAKYPGGKDELDVARFGLELGFYVSQKLGIFLRTESETMDMTGYEQTDTTSSLSADYYFSEQAHLDVALASAKNESDDGGSKSETTFTTIGLTFGYLF